MLFNNSIIPMPSKIKAKFYFFDVSMITLSIKIPKYSYLFKIIASLPSSLLYVDEDNAGDGED